MKDALYACSPYKATSEASCGVSSRAGVQYLGLRERLAVFQSLREAQSRASFRAERETYDETCEVILVLLHEPEELFEDVMPVLYEPLSTVNVVNSGFRRTLAVVLLHVLNAVAAASMASFVSARPISGIVPSSSSVAGSARDVLCA